MLLESATAARPALLMRVSVVMEDVSEEEEEVVSIL